MLFLKIVAGVALVLILVVAIGLLWLRFKVRGWISRLARTNSFLPPLEARLRLEPASESDTQPAAPGAALLRELATPFEAAGFSRLGRFTAGDGRLLVALRHDDGVIAVLTLFEDHGFAELFAVYEEGRAHLITANPLFSDLSHKSLQVESIASPDPQRAVPALRDAGALRRLSLHQFVLAYERIHGVCMDHLLATPPSPTLIQRWAAFKGLPAPAGAELEGVLAQCNAVYDGALDQALKEHARKARGLDRETWERVEEELVVLKRTTTFDEAGGFFRDELAADLMTQLEAQGMTVSQAFAAVNRRQRQENQFVLLEMLNRPVHAQLFIRPIYLEAIDAQAPEQPSGPGLTRFLYQSISPQGEVEKSSLVATDVADARAQLQRMGHTEVTILSANHAVFAPQADIKGLAALLVEAHSDPLPKAVLKIVLGNWIVWAPFVLWATVGLFGGPPYGPFDYAGFALAVVALGWALKLALPSVFYNALLEARSWGRTAEARRYLALTRRFGTQPGFPALAMVVEEAKLMAEEGQVNEALELLGRHREQMDELSYLVHEASVYDAARDAERMIEAQERLVQSAPENQEFRVDLALSLLRARRDLDEVESLLNGLHTQECSALFAAGLYFAQGLLLDRQGHPDQAIGRLQQALEQFLAFNNPLVHAVRAEVSGYLALFLHKVGEPERAREIWNKVAPRLKALRARHVLELAPEAWQQA